MSLGLLIVSIIISALIVNSLQKLWMKFIGADAIFFSSKSKLAVIAAVGFIVYSMINSLFS